MRLLPYDKSTGVPGFVQFEGSKPIETTIAEASAAFAACVYLREPVTIWRASELPGKSRSQDVNRADFIKRLRDNGGLNARAAQLAEQTACHQLDGFAWDVVPAQFTLEVCYSDPETGTDNAHLQVKSREFPELGAIGIFPEIPTRRAIFGRLAPRWTVQSILEDDECPTYATPLEALTDACARVLKAEMAFRALVDDRERARLERGAA